MKHRHKKQHCRPDLMIFTIAFVILFLGLPMTPAIGAGTPSGTITNPDGSTVSSGPDGVTATDADGNPVAPPDYFGPPSVPQVGGPEPGDPPTGHMEGGPIPGLPGQDDPIGAWGRDIGFGGERGDIPGRGNAEHD